MKLGFYKFSKYPYIFTAYAADGKVSLRLPFTIFGITLSQEQFHGALCLGHLDRYFL